MSSRLNGVTSADPTSPGPRLLTAATVRRRAQELGLRPTKTLGQNFVIDPSTVRKIVRTSGVQPGETVVEIGPGLGSLTLGLLEAGARVVAIEVDPVLAAALPATIAEHAPGRSDDLRILCADALTVEPLAEQPTRLVANLPYNVAVPVLLRFLQHQQSLTDVLVMVQAEVADRLAAGPGSRTYGVPSVKAAWYGRASRAGNISRNIFWPVPNVDSALVRLQRTADPLSATGPADASSRPGGVDREAVFTCIDAAFAQRRKTLRAALANWAGSASEAEQILRRAGIDPATRGERLAVEDFVATVAARQERTTAELASGAGAGTGEPASGAGTPTAGPASGHGTDGRRDGGQ